MKKIILTGGAYSDIDLLRRFADKNNCKIIDYHEYETNVNHKIDDVITIEGEKQIIKLLKRKWQGKKFYLREFNYC